MVSLNMALAQMVCTRICHDLGGPAGALSGALELVEGVQDDAMEVARDAARIIDRRIRFFRAAIGGGGGDCTIEGLAQAAEGLTLGRRATTDLTALPANILVPAALSQVLMLAMWTAIDSLPKGGAVRLGGDVRHGISVWPDGPAAAWPVSLASALTGDEVPLTARGLAVPLLVAVAKQNSVRLDLLLGGAPGPAPLLLSGTTQS